LPARARLIALALALALSATGAAATGAEVIQHDNVVVVVHGGVEPKRLPRSGLAPVSVNVGGEISTTDGLAPPQLRTFELEINRHGKVVDRGLPTCRRRQLENATTAHALHVCRDALVGRGHVSAKVALPDQAPFPSEGTLLGFNARIDGQRAVLGHVHGTVPVPLTTVVPFLVGKAPGNTFGVRLTAILPQVASDWGYVTDFSMRFGRRYRQGGRRRSYLNAACPAPKGFPGASFALARASYEFSDAQTFTTVLNRSCKVEP
jgi:hypothetical protein